MIQPHSSCSSLLLLCKRDPRARHPPQLPRETSSLAAPQAQPPETSAPTPRCTPTPTTRFMALVLHAAAEALQLRIIAPDRPGIGGSSPLQGRSVQQYPADLAELCDQLGAAQTTHADLYRLPCCLQHLLAAPVVKWLVFVSGGATTTQQCRQGSLSLPLVTCLHLCRSLHVCGGRMCVVCNSGVEVFSIMASSAGTMYALAATLAQETRHRVVGKVSRGVQGACAHALGVMVWFGLLAA